ncbi:MAG: D-tyrosyl-tRNA(Tyr) deacylase [Propionibacteriaceae bacterium]|jgi:D-tyrosyl-tRNA(Tyr) deacylase|nr:D-tyrosyl-tRNA(Tyr) deacylase [Propionibacteriaceae bacterium]
MRIVAQRASRAEVRVGGAVVGRLARPGLLLLVGAACSDTPAVAERLAKKVWELRILDPALAGGQLEAPAGGWSRGDLSCSDCQAPLLVVSQFTLYADVRKGRRPSWSQAAPGPVAEPLIEAFIAALRAHGAEVETGVFGAMMEVDLVNAGPVTIILEADA